MVPAPREFIGVERILTGRIVAQLFEFLARHAGAVDKIARLARFGLNWAG